MADLFPSRIIALDLETTGLSPMYDYITQIGAVVMEDGVPTEQTFFHNVQPNLSKYKISGEALSVQVGDMEDEDFAEKAAVWLQSLKDRPSAKEVAEKLSDWCYKVNAWDIPVVAHNAAFDHSFINGWSFSYRGAFYDWLSPVWIDTKEMAAKVIGRGGNYGLDAVCARYEITKRTGGHNDLQDAILCGQVYAKLREELMNTGGLK